MENDIFLVEYHSHNGVTGHIFYDLTDVQEFIYCTNRFNDKFIIKHYIFKDEREITNSIANN